MIPTRAPQYLTAPAAPLWLDPNHLGATELVAVDPHRVRVIEGGEDGLLQFFAGCDEEQAAQWDAYVVRRPDQLEPYIFSREQFWLAANVFFSMPESIANTGACEWPIGMKGLGRGGRNRRPLQLDVGTFRHLSLPKQGLRYETKLRERIGAIFDLHEFAVSDLLQPGEIPARPGVSLRPDGKLLQAFVPNTSALIDLEFQEAPAPTKSRPFPRVYSPGGPTSQPAASHQPLPPSGGTFGDDESMLLGSPPEKPSRPAATLNVVRRMPHLELSTKPPLVAGHEFMVSVFLDESAARDDEESNPVEIEADDTITTFPLRVWLVGTGHFDIMGADQGTVTIQRDTARSDTAKFRVRVRMEHGETAPPRLTAIFQYQGRPCGSVSITPLVADADRAKTPPEPPRRNLAVHLAAKPADLTVTIANPSGDGQNFTCQVTTPLLPEYRDGVTRPWPMPAVASEIVKGHFARFIAKDISASLRIANLRGAGVELFKVAPPHFREAFWALIEQKAPLKSISVVSAEPHIPWELMVPNRIHPTEGLQKREALGVEFAVGRWVCGDFQLPAQKIPLSDSWVFAPRYDPTKRPLPLKKAPEESALVRNCYSGAEIDPAVYDQLESAMKVGARSLLHFVCHGASAGAGAQAIICEDRTEFSSTAISGANALPKAMAASHPLVFLNACEVGRTTPALVGTGGFGPAFIEVGASGVLAPLWSVKDTIAHEVAAEFYASIKACPTKPFAEILQTIRARAYAEGGTAEDTYAAYCFYGDPLAASA